MAERARRPVARWQLCKDLRQAREAAGLSQRRASEKLGWSSSKLLRVENEKVGLTPTDCDALLNLYGIGDPQVRAAIKTLAEQTRFAPWAGYQDVLTSLERRFLVDERAAARVRVFEPTLTPQLLRTQQYARILARVLAPAGTTSPLMTDRRMEVLSTRQDAILNSADPAELHFIVDETALIRLACEPDPSGTVIGSVIGEQAAHLREVATRPTIGIQVLPVTGGVHAGLGVGPFALLDFDYPSHCTRLYLRGGQRPVVDDAGLIARYSHLFAELAAAASPPDSICTILDRHFDHPDSVRGDQDARGHLP